MHIQPCHLTSQANKIQHVGSEWTNHQSNLNAPSTLHDEELFGVRPSPTFLHHRRGVNLPSEVWVSFLSVSWECKGPSSPRMDSWKLLPYSDVPKQPCLLLGSNIWYCVCDTVHLCSLLKFYVLSIHLWQLVVMVMVLVMLKSDGTCQQSCWPSPSHDHLYYPLVN